MKASERRILISLIRWHQMMNRMAIRDYRAGCRRVKELAAQLRADGQLKRKKRQKRKPKSTTTR